ncbi:MAG: 1-acyl-sn-glycerol-3-phosphate acyltransferase [SAR202 cluster bacterium]|nr:1-acyl-sn-glycerol-3-phosphate acyltransferase [SAR202 cluster bacterium]
MNLWYNAWMLYGKLTFNTLAQWKVEGRENIPPKGPLLVVSNHLSNGDSPVVMVAFNRPLHALAKDDLFKHRLFGAYLCSMGAHSVNPDGTDKAAIRWALRLLAQDRAILMFPEGTRSQKPGMRPAYVGVAYLALKSQAPIVPVALTGTEGIGPIWRLTIPLCPIHVRIGQPFTLPIIEGKLGKPILQQMTDLIMSRVAALLPPDYRGHYAFPNSTPQQSSPNI